MFGVNRDEGGVGACNWYLSKDLSALESFQPQTGQDQGKDSLMDKKLVNIVLCLTAGLWSDVISFGMF